MSTTTAYKKRRSSAKQRRASQINGQKSQGPITEEGKANSRKNALKHGLTGETLLLDAQDERFDARYEEWGDHLHVEGPIQAYHLRRAVIASLHLDDIDEQLQRSQAYRLANTEAELERQAQFAAEDLGRKLAENGPKIYPELCKTVAGCEYLVNRWMHLAHLLTDTPEGIVGAIGVWQDLRGKFRYSTFHHMQQIEGFNKKAQLAVTAESSIRQFCRSLFTGIALPPEDFEAFIEMTEHPGSRAMLEFASEIFAEIQKLEAEADTLEEFEAPRREQATVESLVDTSATGVLLHRYQRGADLSLHKHLNAVRKEQALEAKSEAPPAPKRNEPGAAKTWSQPVSQQQLSDNSVVAELEAMEQYLQATKPDMNTCPEEIDDEGLEPEDIEALGLPPKPPEE